MNWICQSCGRKVLFKLREKFNYTRFRGGRNQRFLYVFLFGFGLKWYESRGSQGSFRPCIQIERVNEITLCTHRTRRWDRVTIKQGNGNSWYSKLFSQQKMFKSIPFLKNFIGVYLKYLTLALYRAQVFVWFYTIALLQFQYLIVTFSFYFVNIYPSVPEGGLCFSIVYICCQLFSHILAWVLRMTLWSAMSEIFIYILYFTSLSRAVTIRYS